MIHLYLSLGTNQGDRSRNLKEAMQRLDDAFGRKAESVSEIIETQAWGFDGEPFLNCAVMYALPRKRQTVEAQALEILAEVKRIEREMGRDEVLEFDGEGRRIYHPRVIDIDILFFGPHSVCLPELTIPHPLIAERDFVKIPLSQIAKPSLKASFSALFQN